MDSIVKIVVALKLKFLLIILSIGTSYLVEHKLKKEADPLPVIENTGNEHLPGGSGNISSRSLFRAAGDSNVTMLEPDHQSQAKPASFLTDRLFSYQGLEIYFEF